MVDQSLSALRERDQRESYVPASLVLAVCSLPILPLLVIGCALAPKPGGSHGNSAQTASDDRMYQSPVISRQSDVSDGPRHEPAIRVRIEERRGESRIVVICAGPSTLESNVRRGSVPQECIVHAPEGGGIIVNGSKLMTDRVTFTPADPDGTAGTTFRFVAGDSDPLPVRGSLTLQRTANGTFDPIVTIGMEDWVRGSILAEMPSSFGPEALKAQAIAIRTYGLYKLIADDQRVDSTREGEERVRRGDRGFDVASSVADLRYGGVPYEGPNGNEATDATRGKVLTHRGRVFVAYFHSTSGGATIPAWQYFGNFRNFPPLSGTVAPYDGDSPVHEWSLTQKWSDWREKLIDAGLPEDKLGTRLVSVARIYHPGIDRVPEPLEADPARRPLAFQLGTDAGSVTVKATDLRRIIGGSRQTMPSTACVIIPHGEMLTLNGRGWGHGVGMCQFGAKGMAADGASHHEILSRYYPRSSVTRWYTR